MPLSTATAELLAALPAALGGVSLRLHDESGGLLWQSSATSAPASGAAPLRLPLPDGSTLVADLAGDAGVAGLLEQVLRLVVQRDQLELDMESMNRSSLQLLEMVSMIGETLPRLSAAESDEAVAVTNLLALLVAVGVERAVFVGVDAEHGVGQGTVHVAFDAAGHAAAVEGQLDPTGALLTAFLQQVLAGDDAVLLRSVESGPLGEPGTPEHLAWRELLGVPVSYGSGDERVVLGVLLAMDKRTTAYAGSGAIGSQESQAVQVFAAMLGAVLGARKTAALGKELSLAQAIQEQILPAAPPAVAGFDLASDYRTSGEVGGDYFDYIQLADGRTLAVIADVSGHNLASGMVMVGARATLRTLAGLRSDVGQLFTDLAAGMYADLSRTERFLTAAGVALRPGELDVEVVSAGHNDLMLFRAASGRVERICSDSTILGFLAAATYAAQPLRLQPGDCLLVYTDGVTEATDDQGEMFGEDRLAQVLATAARGPARAVVDAVLAAVRAFATANARGDDVTAMAIKALPGPGGRR